MSPDLLAAVALSRVPNVGAKLYRALLSHFHTPDAALRASAAQLRRVAGIAGHTARQFAGTGHWKEAERIVAHANRNAVSILWCGAPDYPSGLAERTDAPPVLYKRGDADLDQPKRLAIVGTRRMTALGGRQIEQLLDGLVGHAPLIVSGLAYGVDIAAHRRALSLGLPTAAVLGSGLGKIYPGIHQEDARKMCLGNGALLSEYPPWMGPAREHFPARNRIVALLTELTLVIESDVRGGSIITANMAHDFGRRVGACPGRSGDPATAGCNALIKSGRARLIESAEDVVRLLQWSRVESEREQLDLFAGLAEPEQALVQFMRGQPSVGIDEVYRWGKITAGELPFTLLELEMQGLITALPGKRYRLVGR